MSRIFKICCTIHHTVQCFFTLQYFRLMYNINRKNRSNVQYSSALVLYSAKLANKILAAVLCLPESTNWKYKNVILGNSKNYDVIILDGLIAFQK